MRLFVIYVSNTKVVSSKSIFFYIYLNTTHFWALFDASFSSDSGGLRGNERYAIIIDAIALLVNLHQPTNTSVFFVMELYKSNN